MSDTKHPSAWQALIDEWAAREATLRPHLPVRSGSVRVRDAVEVGDQAYVLLSFDVDHPWPQEEELSDAVAYTAVIQAERARQPWIERDATRSRSTWRATNGATNAVTVHEHVLGPHRAFSGLVDGSQDSIELRFEQGDPIDATVVDGWFLAIVPEERRIRAVSLGDAGELALERSHESSSLVPDATFARTAGDAMYFSPLDLRSVLPIVRWERAGEVVIVATCIEQYDEGGVLRLRLDGTRADDDTFVEWPRVTLDVDGLEMSSAVCGEYSLADTISLDIGFRPWLPDAARTLGIRIEGIRGAAGEIAPVTLAVELPAS